MSFIGVTFTGLDAATDPHAVLDLVKSGGENRLEFGILRSPRHEGLHPRYPGRHVIENIVRVLPRESLAYHLCDYDAQWAANGDWDLLFLHIDFSWVGRVQVNLDHYSPDQLDRLRRFSQEIERPVIVQWRGDFEDVPGLLLLQDHSAGRGMSPDSWAAIGDDVLKSGDPVGYAGGLGPKTIAGQLTDIKAIKGDHPAWLDCASGVRDADNRFDLEKVRVMINTVYPDAKP